MIPKIIHYVWMGKGEKSNHIKQCMKTWKKHLNGSSLVDAKKVIIVSVLLTITGLLSLLTYNQMAVRYSLLAALLLAAFIMRKRIMKSFNTILSLRQAQS